MITRKFVLGLAVGFLLPTTLASAQDPKDKKDSSTVETELTPEQLEALSADDQGFSSGDAVPAEGEVINVTGSAIQRKEVSTPAPIVVLSHDDLKASGQLSVADILQKLPENANAANRQGSLGGDGSSAINLRSLGSDRTLILVNGRRMVYGGSGADASVDISSIPVGVIERIEVLKDGASTIYGSDAIGGVVNIITRKNFTGVETSMQTGSSQRGDGTEISVGAIGGYRNKRGGFTVSAGFTEQQSVYARDRGWAKPQDLNFKTGEMTPTRSQATEQGTLRTGAIRPGEPGNGAWQNIRGQDPAGNGRAYILDQGGFRPFDKTRGDGFDSAPYMQIVTPRRLFNLYSEGDYLVVPHVKTFFEANFSRRESAREIAPNILQTGTEAHPDTGQLLRISGQNAFNPFNRDLQGGVDSFMRRMSEGGTRRAADDMNLFRVVAGVEGDLPSRISDTWHWTATANYGRTMSKSRRTGEYLIDRVANAIGPSTPDGKQCLDGSGQVIPGCVPLDLFGGPNTVTPDMLNYIGYGNTSTGYNQLLSLQASANGRLFKTPWGGDVRLALGGEHRRETGGFTPDAEWARGNVTGVKSSTTDGGYNVTEGFTELQIVPVVGKAWAKWLEVNGSIRAFDYSTFGHDFTWKVGGLWKVAGGLAARSTYSTAFHAPNIGLMFGSSAGFPQASDPCSAASRAENPAAAANCAADGLPPGFDDDRTQYLYQFQGNQNLKAEKGKIFTAGLTYESTFLEGLQASADYYDISLQDTLFTPDSQFILDNCYASPNRQFCDQVHRDAGGGISRIDGSPINVTDGGDRIKGMDFSLGLTHAFPIGRLTNSLHGAHVLSWVRTRGQDKMDGAGKFDTAVAGALPDWKFVYNLGWNYKGFGLGTNLRYIRKYKECVDKSCGTTEVEMSKPSRMIPTYFTGDANASYQFKLEGFGPSEMTFGVNNFLDKDPPFINGGDSFKSDAETYDYMGRFFYLRYIQSF